MKNITIMVLSVLLTHFNAPSAAINNKLNRDSADAVASEVNTLYRAVSAETAAAAATIPATPAAAATNLSSHAAPTVVKDNRRLHIQSAVNLTNRSVHRQLESSDRVVQTENIGFGVNESELESQELFNRILAIADQMLFQPELRVSLSGNTDDTGTDHYNNLLSYRRAANIKAYLVELGVPENNIILSFNGAHYPAATNETDEGRSVNRRVDMLLYK